MTTTDDYSRPAPEHRWIGGRTQAGIIRLRTRWLYSKPDPRTKLPQGRTRWPFSRGGKVHGTDWPPHSQDDRQKLAEGDLNLHRAIWDAIESFGDDAELEIEVRLATDEAKDQKRPWHNTFDNAPSQLHRSRAPHMPETVDDAADLITALAAVIRQVDGSHSLGAAALAEALVEHGVRFEDPQLRVYAPATMLRDGTVEPVTNPFNTRAEAEEELAGLLGDDYYRDRRPFIATSIAPVWRAVR